jgi:hypothetical protein
MSKNMVLTTEFRVARGLLGALGGGSRRNELKDRN